MAVAVKHSPETSTGNPFDRMPVVSLVGMVYVLSSLVIVFKLLPMLWVNLFHPGEELSKTPFSSQALLGLVMLGAATGLVVLGGRLLGSRAMPGVKAGIFVSLVGFLFLLLLTRWFSLWVEHFIYNDSLFGSNGPTVGIVLVAVFFGGLLLLGVRWFNRPSFEKSMIGLENQGWFTGSAYKKQQGMKVRRGTILGILLLIGAGIYTMIAHKTLERGPADWALNIPFTGMVTVTNDTAGDADRQKLRKAANTPGAEGNDSQWVLDRYKLRDINDEVDPAKYVKIYNPEKVDTEFKDGEIVPRDKYEKEMQQLANAKGYNEFDRATKKWTRKVGDRVEDFPGYAVKPEPASGEVTYTSITILPAVRFTLPLVLLGLTLWFAWRVVNVPTFADFLIATEAELNKVSWTTRRRLYQDTIVVLVTVFLMAAYLFAMDQFWSHLLSWKPIGVIVINKQDTAKGTDQKPW